MTEKFQRVMNHVLRFEGGYANNPADPGGETKYGISKRWHPHLDIKNLTREQALEIYWREYWQRIQGDDRPYPEALAVMDFAVHSGVGTALAKWQEAEDVLDYLDIRRDYLLKIGNEKFLRGWLRRVRELEHEIRDQVVEVDVELVQVFGADRMVEVRPVAASLGRTNGGRKKLMVRI